MNFHLNPCKCNVLFSLLSAFLCSSLLPATSLVFIYDRSLSVSLSRIALFGRWFGRNNDNPLGTPLFSSFFFSAAGEEGVDPELLIHRDIVPVCLGLLPSCAEPSASRCHAGMHLNITGGGELAEGWGGWGRGFWGTCSNL